MASLFGPAVRSQTRVWPLSARQRLIHTLPTLSHVRRATVYYTHSLTHSLLLLTLTHGVCTNHSSRLTCTHIQSLLTLLNSPTHVRLLHSLMPYTCGGTKGYRTALTVCKRLRCILLLAPTWLGASLSHTRTHSHTHSHSRTIQRSLRGREGPQAAEEMQYTYSLHLFSTSARLHSMPSATGRA